MENQNPAVSASENSQDTNMPQSTNNNETSLSDNVRRLSLAAAAETALPASPLITHTSGQATLHAAPSPYGLMQMPRSPLRRTPSSSSIASNARSTTPTLLKRTSLSSLKSVGGATPPRSPSFRRASSILANSPQGSMGANSALPASIEEPSAPSITATSVAHDYFQKELEAHSDDTNTKWGHETVVILQDACYGHRYSRPRTSRASLSTIVERPERIHASILGLATAYVRLGERHAGGHSAPHPKIDRKSLSSMAFKIHKTTRTLPLTSQAATAIHGTKWMEELIVMCDAAEAKLALSGKELTRPITAEQTNGSGNADKTKLHEGDLYLCSESLSALEGALGGVCEGVDAVFAEKGPKRAFVCIRPPGHHCSADYPSGFCWLNNVHVGIGHAAITHELTHAAIIDFDLHHGDGSQSITWQHNARVAALPRNAPVSKKTAIGYFSLHDINSYPCEMGDEEKVRNASLCLENAHGQTLWNVHLQPWKTELEFWELYKNRYLVLLSKARSFLLHHTDRLRQAPTHPQPKAAIFLSAGFDASEWESPGMQRHQVNVPTEFYARFTRDVVKLAEEVGLGVDGRVISILEGGYSDRALTSGVLSHLSGLTVTNSLPREVGMSNGLGHEMGRKLGRLGINGNHTQEPVNVPRSSIKNFDASWWELPRLEEIENLVNPPAPLAATRKVRNATPTYTSSTQSYTAKIVAPAQSRRSFSSSATGIHPSSCLGSRVPSPPPPEVDWATAALELSKLLIPSDRQTRSCKPEDLNAEASRVRRDRHSTIGLSTDMPATDGKRMQLRGRKIKAPKATSEDDVEKPVSKSSRRKTTANVATLDDEVHDIPGVSAQILSGKPVAPKSRRLSMASSVGSINGERIPDSSRAPSTDNQPRQDSLIVQKRRVLSASPIDAPKARAVRKTPPVPRVPSTYSSTSKPKDPRAQAQPTLEISPAPLSQNEDLKNKDVDYLVSGMKKMSIKLNVKPKQEQKATEPKAKPAPRGRPKSTAPKAVKTTAASKAVTENQFKDIPSVAPPGTGLAEATPLPMLTAALPTQIGEILELPSQPTIQESTDTRPTSLLSRVASTVPALIPQSEYNGTNPPNVHLKEGTSPYASDFASAPPLYHPPSMQRPGTPKHTREDLPLFTSTSPILFGKPSIPIATIDQAVEPDSFTDPAQPVYPSMESDHVGRDYPVGEPPVARPDASSGFDNAEMAGQPPSANILDIPHTPR